MIQLIQVAISCSECADTPVSMINGQAVLIDDTVYYGGGETKENNTKELQSICCYSSSCDEWSTLPLHPCIWFGLGQIDQCLITIGGMRCIDAELSSDMYNFNVTTQKWQNMLSPMPTPRRSLTIISDSSCLIAAGGIVSSDPVYTNIIEIYDTTQHLWTRINEFPISCSFLTGGVHNNNVYLVGGRQTTSRVNRAFSASLSQFLYSDHNGKMSMAESLTTRNKIKKLVWNEIENTPVYWPLGVTTDMVLTIGGNRSSALPDCENTSSIFAYSALLNMWFLIGDLPAAVSNAASVALSQKEFLLIGGRDEKGDYSNIVRKISYEHIVSLQ